MQSTQDFGFIITDAGFEYNDNTYDIGGNGSGQGAGLTIIPTVFPTEALAREALIPKAREELGEYQIGVFSEFEGYNEPAFDKAQEIGLNTGYEGDTYETFFQKCGEKNIDVFDFLPTNLYDIHRVDLSGNLLLINQVPDEKIKEATDKLQEIHEDLS